jgi:hypothetical protein
VQEAAEKPRNWELKLATIGVGTEKEAIPLNGVVEGFKKRQQ